MIAGILIAYIADKYFERHAFGMGDVKLVSLLALNIGTDVWMVFYMAIVLSGVFALMMILKGKLKLKDRLSLAPFVLISFILYQVMVINSKLIGIFSFP